MFKVDIALPHFTPDRENGLRSTFNDKVDFLPQNEKDWLFAIIYTALLAVLSLVFIFLSFGRKKYVRITGGIYLLLFITIVLLIFGGSMLRNKLFYNLTFYLHFVLQTPIVVGVMFFYFWKLRPMKVRDKV